MRGRLLLALVFVFSPIGCPGRTHDYIFEVTGVVTAEDGEPLKDAEVTLKVNGPVYEAITLVRSVKRTTDGTGGFIFMYISHQRGAKYSLTVRKEGFEPETVSGSSPPVENHVIRLKGASGNGTSPDVN